MFKELPLRSYIEHMLDSFLTMVDAPSNIKDLIDIVKQKKIETKMKQRNISKQEITIIILIKMLILE